MQPINEALTDIVYHFTTKHALINIIKTNKFMTTHVFRDYDDEYVNRGRFFYFSTTRGKTRPYMSYPVKLVLNGRLLNQKYKGGAVNYFGRNEKFKKNKWKGGEWEDRLFTDKPFIPNALKYVLEIHIFLNGDNVISPELAKVASEAEKNSIPIFYYDDRKYWLTERKSKALDYVRVGYTGDVSGEQNANVSNSVNFYNLMQLAAHANEDNLSFLLNKVENREEFVRDAEEQKDLFRPSLYEKDKEIYYRAIAYTKDKPDDMVRFVLTLIVREMRKLKIRDFVEYVRYKFFYNTPNKSVFNEKIFNLIKVNIEKELSNELRFESTKNMPMTVIVGGSKFTYENFLEMPFIKQYLKSKLEQINSYVWDLIDDSDTLFSGGFMYALVIKKKANLNEIDVRGLVEMLPEPGVNVDDYNEVLIKMLGNSIEWGFRASDGEIKRIYQEYYEKY